MLTRWPYPIVVKVIGTEGSARYSYNDHVVNAKHIVHSHSYVPYRFTVRAEDKHFVDCVQQHMDGKAGGGGQDGAVPLSTIDDAITCQKIVEGVERSIAESRHVTIE